MSSRVIPLYPELISIGNNVRLAAKVSLIPHDMIHAMLNNRWGNTEKFREYVGCIKIDDNVLWALILRYWQMSALEVMSSLGPVRLSKKTWRADMCMREFPQKRYVPLRNLWKRDVRRLTIPWTWKETVILWEMCLLAGCGMRFAKSTNHVRNSFYRKQERQLYQ